MESSASSPPNSTTTPEFTEYTEFIQVKWSIPLFFHYVVGHVSYRPNDISERMSGIRPYTFWIGGSDNPENPNALKAEASLVMDESTVMISFGLSHDLPHPLYNVTMNVESLRILQSEYGPVIHDSEITFDMLKVNLRHANCVRPLITVTAARNLWIPYRDPFISFKLNCRISRPAFPIDPKEDLALCSSQCLSNFATLLNDSATADVELKVPGANGQSFKCHKIILAVRSPVFQTMFETRMKERMNNVVEVKDIPVKVMEHFLHFIYSGRFQDDSWIESLPFLAYVSDKYDVQSLKEFCDSQLILSVTFDNAIALDELASRHGLSKAVSHIKKFLAENAEHNSLVSSEDST